MDKLPTCRVCSAFVSDLYSHLQWHLKNEGQFVINWDTCPLCEHDTYTKWDDRIEFQCGHTFKNGTLGYGRLGTAKVD